MTTAQKQSAITLITAFAVPLLVAVATIGAARQQLADKEPASAHALDIRDVRSEIHDVRGDMREQQIRDSAQMATVISRLNDVACDQNPRRSYCRGGR